ncbi:uncharacterized protein LOC111332885 [Stylophora pistillata]|uniref:uncharacterized protein LOC111332885 n=1 Tax=Stylophora pistillata TaxID=50429 RepID=UPI000C042DF0|nr:uncharacterized protein LOC111332885 [Stylophora pistillata]
MATPRQETGGPQSSELALPRPPQEMESENPSAAKRLAEVIAALLVALFNLPGGSFTIFCTIARSAVQYFFQIPPINVEERDKVKLDGEEIKLRLKEISHEGNKLEEKFSNFPYHSAVNLIKWEWDLSIARDRLAKCGIDIHISQGFLGRLISDLQTKVKWTILQVITGLLFPSAVIGRKFNFLSLAEGRSFSCI